MDTVRRTQVYLAQTGRITGPQRRRLIHKGQATAVLREVRVQEQKRQQAIRAALH